MMCFNGSSRIIHSLKDLSHFNAVGLLQATDGTEGTVSAAAFDGK